MKLKTSLRAFAALSLGGWLIAGCGSADSDGGNVLQEQAASDISIDFAAMMGDELLACSDENNQSRIYDAVGTSDDSVSITDFRFFISNVKLIKADGTRVAMTMAGNDNQYQAEGDDNVALLDFEDGTGNCHDRGNTPNIYHTIVGTVAEGDYTGLEFTLGVPFEINHDDDSYVDVKALNQPNMAWSWQAGRKFTKMEVRSESNTSLIWNFHLGSTGCVANSDENSTIAAGECAQPNRVTVVLDNFDAETDKVKVDYKALLANNNVSTDQGKSKGCMSALIDPECQVLLKQLALDVDARNGLCVNENDCSTQQLFSAVLK